MMSHSIPLSWDTQISCISPTTLSISTILIMFSLILLPQDLFPDIDGECDLGPVVPARRRPVHGLVVHGLGRVVVVSVVSSMPVSSTAAADANAEAVTILNFSLTFKQQERSLQSYEITLTSLQGDT